VPRRRNELLRRRFDTYVKDFASLSFLLSIQQTGKPWFIELAYFAWLIAKALRIIVANY